MKHMVAVAQIEKPIVEIKAYPEPLKTKIPMPDGGLGIIFVFESKAAAYRWYGKKVKTFRIEFDKPIG